MQGAASSSATAPIVPRPFLLGSLQRCREEMHRLLAERVTSSLNGALDRWTAKAPSARVGSHGEKLERQD